MDTVVHIHWNLLFLWAIKKYMTQTSTKFHSSKILYVTCIAISEVCMESNWTGVTNTLFQF